MCLAAAYQSVESDQPVLQKIAHVRINGNRVELVTLLGEKKVLQGKIREIDFVNSKLIIETQPLSQTATK
jgi:predicted RNA-binding protein